VLIYALATVLLLTGGLWWFTAAPEESRSPLLAQWEATAQQLLPEVENQADSGMLTLSAGSDRTIESNVGIGEFVVSVVCVGRESSRIRVSLGEPGTDSGRGLACGDDVNQDTFSVSLAGTLRLRVSVGDVGPVIFRYAVLPTL
jgi:hypothetical protein